MLSLLNSFSHGYVAVPVISACRRAGLFELFEGGAAVSVSSLTQRGNAGYLGVALHMLESLGWVAKTPSGDYRLTADARFDDLPADLDELYRYPIDELLVRSESRELVSRFIRAMVSNAGPRLFDGAVMLPLLIALRQGDVALADLDADVRALFCRQDVMNEGGALTELGAQLIDRAYVMAIAGSYRPMLARMDDLLFGDAQAVFRQDPLTGEAHVDRRLNVVASGFQHERFFRDAEERVLEIFNRLPVEAQPRAIADMGCGDGSFLKQLYLAIRDRSKRGKWLHEFPVTLVGVDYNEAALVETRRTLEGLPHVTLAGDINDPLRLLEDLRAIGIDPDGVLHLRSFLDHNFRYEPPAEERAPFHLSPGGAHVDGNGASIPDERLLHAWAKHLLRWAGVVNHHGLIVLESHCLSPEMTRRHFDAAENFYFDALHAFSRQYLIDAESFLVVAATAGLFPKAQPARYPKTLPYCRITLSHFEKRDYVIRHAALADLDALVELEALCWPAELRASRADLQLRMERCPEGQFVVDDRDERPAAVIYSQRIESGEALRGATIDDVTSLHRPDGPVVQLLAVNVAPRMQERNLGDQLLEFMLQRCSVMNGVTSVAGVTRCRDYGLQRALALADYIQMRDGHGLLVDPILRFHELHGATIGALVPDYRPADAVNEGCGVLISYDIHNRERGRRRVAPFSPAQDTVADFLENALRRFLGTTRESAFAVDRPLMEMGLDSIDLLELHTQIQQQYRLDLTPTFFFQYNTAEKIRAFIEPRQASREPPLTRRFAPPSPHGDEAAAGRGDSIGGFSREPPLTRRFAPPSPHGDEAAAGRGDSIGGFSREPPLPRRFAPPSPLGDEAAAGRGDSTEEALARIKHRVASPLRRGKKVPLRLRSGQAPADEGSPSWQNVRASHHITPGASAIPLLRTGLDGIAIIGIACRLPGGIASLDGLWSLLKEGQSAIGDLPEGRFSWPSDIDPNGSHRGIARGGFMSDVDRFDAPFFRISPKEAECMDPQQRILIELAWQALEDAGYPAQSLAGSDTSVYIGASGSDYARLLDRAGIDPTAHSGTGASMAVLPNRISYFFDFHGPSLQIDTACSSSLVAVHEAMQSLRDGESSMALVGGVNLICYPANSIIYYKAGMLSKDGRCKTFDKGADGYVRAEGAIMVLLKPVERAVADGDRIYAVLRGSATNHGGQASGLTVPNPERQAKLLTAAWRAAGIEPETLGYIEAHGTGTSLGDPIEVQGLKEAFGDAFGGRGSCGLGSIKSNLGHLEAAAGLAGLLKLVLCLRKQEIPPTLHCDELNPHIDLGDGPFEIVRHLRSWPAPAAGVRRAGVSSFGSGGTNAHVVLEEYTAPIARAKDEGPFLFVLSAKNDERLRAYVDDVLTWFAKNATTPFADLIFTLQTGRQAMDERLALVAADKADLQQKLTRYLAGDPIADCFHENVRNLPAAVKALVSAESAEELRRVALRNRDLRSLAVLWTSGVTIDWRSLYAQIPNRIEAPTYPFARERHWIPVNQSAVGSRRSAVETAVIGSELLPAADRGLPTGSLHPLLDRRAESSTEKEQKFLKVFHKDELFLRDHVVGGRVLLPGVAHLEMARAAAEASLGEPVTAIRDVIWGRPLVVDDGMDNGTETASIRIIREDGASRFTIHREGDPAWVFSQGTIERGTAKAERARFDLAQIKAGAHVRKEKADVFARLTEIGFAYGPSFQLSEETYCGETEALVRIRVPETSNFTLHPSLFTLHFVWQPWLLDTVLRASFLIGFEQNALNDDLRVPFSLAAVRQFAPLPERCWAYARLVRMQKDVQMQKGDAITDVSILDEDGLELLRFERFFAKRFREKRSTSTSDAPFFYRPVWERAQPEPRAAGERTRIVVDYGTGEGAALRQRLERPVESRSLRTPLDVVCLLPDVDGLADADGLALREGLYAVVDRVQELMREEPRRPARILACYRGDGRSASSYAAIAGLAKAMPGIATDISIVTIDADDPTEALLRELECNTPNGAEVRYRAGERWVRRIERAERPRQDVPAFRRNGSYLVTGAMGGLGFQTAAYLAKNYQADLILLGRSAPDPKKLDALRATARSVEYLRVDVSDRDALAAALRQVRENGGRIDGVLHCAGVAGDAFTTQTTRDEFERAICAKVHGTINLDELTKDDALDFFILFSSLSSLLGDFSSGSYAAANRFLDDFAEARTGSGKTLSINWPYWADGGFSKEFFRDERGESVYFQQSGFLPLSTARGMEVLELALAFSSWQIIVATGEREKIERALGLSERVAPARPIAARARVIAPQTGELVAKTRQYLTRQIAAATGLAESRIGAEDPLDGYGIDSMIIMDLNRRLQADFASLPGTLFFEYTTIRDLAQYFVENRGEELRQVLNEGASVQTSPPVDRIEASPRPIYEETKRTSRANSRRDVAIIGMSGRYPMARNLDELWANLRDGRDCIETIPTDRWDYRKYFQPDHPKPGQTNSKWGGFIADVDKFDPLFFSISPREANYIDPQQRLFAEVVWEACEDACYRWDRTSNKAELPKENNVGVFIGSMYDDYQFLEKAVSTSYWNSFIANRVSYFFNFRGPSIMMDTACSSSLTAIYMAYESVKNGECYAAIAGGTNLSIHPTKYSRLTQLNLLSSEGKCRAFGAGGNGYVPGEGIGAILLKSLDDAVRDGDRIYAVIKGGSINHGGKTNGLTVPNPNAHAALISDALRNSDIDPRRISYVEAHGTGTSLGDPIELAGLTKAFRKHTNDKQFCAIGSVKSNVGHLEGTAGVVAVTKVVLQMKYGQLVPSLHSETLNPLIDFQSSPFTVQRELAEWKRPRLVIDGEEKEIPRLAGISSFGAGGSNAHILIEEYVPASMQEDAEERGPFVVPLSARNGERLRAYAERLLAFLDEPHEVGNAPRIADIAYSLQVGRESMTERVGFLVSSIEELRAKLTGWLALESDSDRARKEKDALRSLVGDADLAPVIDAWLQSRNLTKLLDGWVKGFEVDWTRLYAEGSSRTRKISLPTYPFASESYWVPDAADVTSSMTTETSALHPLLGANVSTFAGQRFRTTFRGDEAVLADHVIGGKTILPAVAYLEMICAGGRISKNAEVTRITDVVWSRPVVVDDEAVEIDLELRADGNGARFDVRDANRGIHAQGRISYQLAAVVELRDVRAIEARCCEQLDGAECYAVFRKKNFEYGPSFRCIQRVWRSERECLSLLEPAADAAAFDGFRLHPGLLDSALQGSLLLADDGSSSPYVPYSLTSLEIFGALNEKCYGHVRARENARADEQSFDVEIIGEGGAVLARLENLVLRAALRESRAPERFHYRNVWIPSPLELLPANAKLDAPMLVFIRDAAAWNADVIRVRPGASFNDLGGNEYELNPGNADDCAALLRALDERGIHPGFVVHAWSQSTFATDRQRLDEQLRYGLDSMFHLTRALVERSAARRGSNVRLLYVYDESHTDAEPLHAAMGGFFRSVNHETPSLVCRTLALEEGANLADAVHRELASQRNEERNVEIRHRDGQRWVMDLQRVDVPPVEHSSLKDGGVYLITGGAGGLGLVFAKYLAERWNAHVVLAGRSSLTEEKAAQIREIGGDVSYERSDVTSRSDVDALVASIKERFGRIDGILHAAGVARNAYLRDKTREQLDAVIAPKVFGTVHLDEATRDEPLDFFALFSSISAVVEIVGQSDYSFANRFLDHYASWRERLRDEGHRRGKTIAINWPLWKDGGMHVDRESEAYLRSSMGIDLFASESGLETFESMLASGERQLLVVEGDARKIERALVKGRPQRAVVAPMIARPDDVPPEDFGAFQGEMLKKVSTFLEMDPAQVEPEVELMAYGVDSINSMAFTSEINRDYDLDLSPSVLFEYPTVASFSRHVYETVRNDGDRDVASRDPSLRESAVSNDAPRESAPHPPSAPSPHLDEAEVGRGVLDVGSRESAVSNVIYGERAPHPTSTLDRGTPEFAQAESPSLPIKRVAVPLSEHPPQLRPLTHGQRALWFLHQLAPESCAYHIALTFRVVSPLDVDVFRDCFQLLVNRHPSLRTGIRTKEGEPVQEIHDSRAVAFEIVDAAGWSAETLDSAVRASYERPFDLGDGSLLRVVLFRISSDEHVCLLVVHHIVADAWSIWTLMKELGASYSARLAGHGETLAPLNVTYADFMAWQGSALRSSEGAALGQYWQQRLGGELSVLNLPIDRARPKTQTFRGQSRQFTLSEALSAQLAGVARGERATIFMTLLAAFQVLLHRYSGDEVVMVGSPTSGRTDERFNDVVGYFVNPVVLRGDLSAAPTFREFLRQIRGTVLQALEHQNYPFPLLVELLNPDRHTGRSPLFQAELVFQKAQGRDDLIALLSHDPEVRTRIGGLELAAYPFAQQEGQFDVTLEMMEIGRSLSGSLKYNSDLFEPATIERMVEHFRTLLEAIVAAPDARVSELALTTERERNVIRDEWNRTEAPYPSSTPMYRLFEEQVKRHPEKQAVFFGDRHLTYGELNARANRLARHLRNAGVGPESLVGIHLPRSLDMLVALLAVMKAGGAYVPMDPTYPSARLVRMLQHAAPRVLLTRSDVDVLGDHDATVIYLDDEGSRIDQESAEDLDVVALPESPAYVIYTSGSTGDPKGVLVPHRALTNFLCSMQSRLGFREADRLLSVTTISFDIAALELYLPLIAGASLTIVDSETAADGAALIALLAAGDITAMQATPTTWQLLLASGWKGTRGLTVYCGGEALPRALGEQLLERAAAVWNLYGPTETTIWSSLARVTRDAHPRLSSASIGRPIDNTTLYVLDHSLSLVPPGVVGDLYIGGDGLARGYVNRPDLTAERFVPDPFGNGGRLYRTGDLARYLADGEIEFVGRGDQQLKIRGFRIELGEVEAALRKHEGIVDPVVVARGTGSQSAGGKTLAAYFVPRAGFDPQPKELREFVSRALPEYMVPTAFVKLDKLPLTLNNKIDRKALPDPDRSAFSVDSAYVSPATPTQEVLAALWIELLGCDRIGIHDRFFDIGGNSMLAAKLIFQIHDRFAVQLPVSFLFEYPTVDGLAQAIDEQKSDARSTSKRGAQVELDDRELLLIFDKLQKDELDVEQARFLTGA